MNAPDPGWRPGRTCPLHYRYAADVFRREPDRVAKTLYVIGGLYGNLPALEAIERMAAAEPDETTLVFNGDFHWFDVDDATFEAINRGVLTHEALRGNVETELASDDDAGCGCGYPDSVPDEDVERSNAILRRLRDTSRRHPASRARLAALPMHRLARVGDLRIGIVHGDGESLAGWRFDASAIDRGAGDGSLAAMFDAAGVDAFASSHTCLPVLRGIGGRWIANNGAAGMPNFAGTRFGVITRISVHAPRDGDSLYGTRVKDVRIDALPVRYDAERWLREFTANWPEGSAAHRSYHRRIVGGPSYRPEQARPANA